MLAAKINMPVHTTKLVKLRFVRPTLITLVVPDDQMSSLVQSRAQKLEDSCLSLIYLALSLDDVIRIKEPLCQDAL